MNRTFAVVCGLLAAGLAPCLAADASKDAAPAARPAPVQTEQTLERQGAEGKTLRMSYLLYLPPGHGKDKQRWPLMLFLHGAGERGTDLSVVKKHGPPKLVEKGQSFPFVVVSPQCPRGVWWDSNVLTALLDEVCAKYAVDTDRVYLTGLSMGGFGTWRLAALHPERFAAIVPICGGGDVKDAPRLKDIPTRVYHGGKDPVVRVGLSEQMVEAMKKAGAKDVTLTVYPDAGHDSWTKTYDDPELYTWLLKQTSKGREKPVPATQPAEIKART